MTLGVAVAIIAIVQKALLGDGAATGMRIYGFWKPRYMLTTPFGPFVNRNHFAGWMLLVLPFTVACLLGAAEQGVFNRRAGWRERLLWLSTPRGGRLQLTGLAVLVMGLSLVMSQSRSGALCFAIAIAVGAVAAARRHRSNTIRLAIAGALMLVVALSVVWSDVRMTDRFALRVDDSIPPSPRDLECHGANHPRLSADRHGPEHVRHRDARIPGRAHGHALRRSPQRLPPARGRRWRSSDRPCPRRISLHGTGSPAPVRRARQPGRIVLAAPGRRDRIDGDRAAIVRGLQSSDARHRRALRRVPRRGAAPAAIRDHLVMSVSPVTTRTLAARFVNAVAQVLRGQMLLALGGAILVALAEGAGLVLLVPLLGTIGLTVSEGPTTGLAHTVERTFGWFGLQPTLPAVLRVFVIVSLTHATLVRANSLIAPRLEQRFITSLRQRLYAALIGARWSFLAQQKSSDLVHAVTVDIERVSMATYQLFALASASVITVAYLAVALRLSVPMTVAAALGGAMRPLGNARTDAGIRAAGRCLCAGEP